MICPVCKHDNLEGLDNCENCNADLRTADIPQPHNAFESRLMTDHISELSPREPFTVSPDEPIASAIALMQRERIGCVPVISDGDLVGIFTERDALLKLATRSLDGITVKDVMTPDPVALRREDTPAVALHKMAVGGFRHIPLVEEGRLTGIISARDIFRHVISIL
ncbi:MAG: CBS domain-containing protein [Dehalococcoidia bacterium]|nr:CBS domain-containing protein [Dehalococcoidia bacterium]